MQTFRFEFYLVLYSYCYCCCSCCAFASFAIPSSCPLRQSSLDSRVPNANAEPQYHFWFVCQASASPFKVLTVQSLQLSASGTAFNTNAKEELNVARWLCLRAARLGYQSRFAWQLDSLPEASRVRKSSHMMWRLRPTLLSAGNHPGMPCRAGLCRTK